MPILVLPILLSSLPILLPEVVRVAYPLAVIGPELYEARGPTRMHGANDRDRLVVRVSHHDLTSDADPWLRDMRIETGRIVSLKMVVVIKDCGSREFAIGRVDPGGRESSRKWAVNSLLLPNCAWRVTYGTWQVNSLAVGEHRVDLTVDGLPGGAYKFTVR